MWVEAIICLGAVTPSHRSKRFGAFNATCEIPPQSSPVASSLSPMWIGVSQMSGPRTLRRKERQEAASPPPHPDAWGEPPSPTQFHEITEGKGPEGGQKERRVSPAGSWMKETGQKGNKKKKSGIWTGQESTEGEKGEKKWRVRGRGGQKGDLRETRRHLSQGRPHRQCAPQAATRPAFSKWT